MEKEAKIIKHRMAYLIRLPVLIMTLWCLWLLYRLVTRVDPIIVQNILLPNSYSPFFILLFMVVFGVVWVISLQLMRSLLWGLAISGIMVLRLIGLGNILNLILVFGLIVSFEVYWWRDSMKKERG